MDIKVLGTSCCGKCDATLGLVEQVAKARGVTARIEQLSDWPDFAAYGVMSTPAVVIDGKVVHAGGVPSRDKVEQWFTGLPARS